MRINGKGLIDRSRPVTFRFNGREYQGFRGDTLASALLANEQRLFGRSFKYHRPRGVLTAGSAEPNALVEVVGKSNVTPNVRATMQEVFDGLETRSQNHLGSLRYDLLAVNDLLSPFLGAGFYYKTFTWPRAFWDRLYEPIIRRAAGLGRLSGRPDEGVYEKAWAFCDLLVIGAGPSGLMAALVAGRAGADVIIADEAAEPGGEASGASELIGEIPAQSWIAASVAELRAMPNVRFMTRTTVTGAYDQGVYGALERVGLHRAARPSLPRECFWRIVAGRAILASGATERMVAFANNDRPGIMLAGAVRSYLNRYGVVPGKRVTIFAGDDQSRLLARELVAAGVQVAAIIDPREEATQIEDCPVHTGAVVINTEGRHGLRAITVRKGSQEFRIETDLLAVSGGWNPALHLTCHLGARPRWSDELQAFLPVEGAVPGLVAVGAANGSYSTHGALASGRLAALDALAALGRSAPEVALPAAEDAPRASRALWVVETDGKSRAWLDFANDVTVKDVRQAAEESFTSPELMKRYTTQGMAPDQGRNSSTAAMAVLADATGRAIAATGSTTFRAPYTPVSIAAMGAGGRAKGFAPERLLTSDQASRDRLAPMIATGLWYRPSYFPKPGESTWREACDREVAMVRNFVGVADVSTLGKIDIQGRDAGRFLDFVYANRLSTLKPGRVRYGVMLREDGMVLDDGTTARLADNHWVMTTTTGAYDLVWRHLTFVQQAFCAGFDLRLTPVTEAWAQFAITGPMALGLLESLGDASVADLPFMGCRELMLGSVTARLFRISFSGEAGYEIAVPVRYGEALYRDLLARAETLGGGPYGLEALNVLRLEKGFLTHAEMDGRTTAFDLGLGAMVADKDAIGRQASQRPGLWGPERLQLVGLKSQKPLSGGGHLFRIGAAAKTENIEGHVTSAAYSPTLGCYIALALVADGRARIGEKLRFVDHLRALEAECDMVSPVFYDAEGGRMRA